MCSRMGRQAPSVRFEAKHIRLAAQVSGKQIQRTHPHHLTALRPAPDGALRWWDVVNTITLSETAEAKGKLYHGIQRYCRENKI